MGKVQLEAGRPSGDTSTDLYEMALYYDICARGRVDRVKKYLQDKSYEKC